MYPLARRTCIACLTLLVALLSLSAGAQQPSSSTVGAFDPVAATEAYLSLVTPEDQARSDAYVAGERWLMLWDFLAVCAVSILLLETGVSARLRDLSLRFARPDAMRNAIYAICYMAVFALLTFPLAYYEGFSREHQYELFNLDLNGWIREFALSWAVQIAVSEDIYQFDGSRQSDRISADVSGLFGTTRFALSDTTLAYLSPEAVKAVVDHELGHYVYDHIAWLGEALHREPGAIEEFLFLQHPPGRSRIYASMRWKAAQLEGG